MVWVMNGLRGGMQIGGELVERWFREQPTTPARISIAGLKLERTSVRHCENDVIHYWWKEIS